MGFVANFARFLAVQKMKFPLSCDRVTASLRVGTFF